MKKYWKLLVMSIVIIFGVSVHYMQMAKALEEEDVALTIDTVEGDASVLDEAILHVSYYDRYLSKWMYISTDEASNVSESYERSSIFARREPIMFKQYLQDYRSFMRGKELMLSHYVEDEARIVYVKARSINKTIFKGEPLTLQVDILTKDTNERVKFDAKALAKLSYDWLQVEDVHAEEGELKVLVSGSSPDGRADLQLYTIDEKTQQVTNAETLAETEVKENTSSTVNYYGNPRMVNNEQYYVYQQRAWVYDESTGKENETLSEYYVYTLQTNENEALPVTGLKNIQTAFQHEQMFYVVTAVKNELTLHTYHLQDKKWAEPLTMKLAFEADEQAQQMKVVDRALNSDRTPYVQVKDDKVYVANPVSNTNELFVYDLATGKLVYGGIVQAEGVREYAEILVEQIY